MAEQLTQEDFSKQLNTTFRVKHDKPEPVLDLVLTEVTGYPLKHQEQGDMERFTLTFRGRGDLIMPQHTYTLEHEELGELAVFLVPVGHVEGGFSYQAVFNYFVK